MATTAQYEDWLHFVTTDEDQIKFYTEFFNIFLITGVFLEPLIGWLLDWITLNVFQKKYDYQATRAKSLTAAIFMTIASVLACLCSVFQLFDSLGVFTVLYLSCHVLLISFLYSSRYVALVVNTPPGAQGQIIATVRSKILVRLPQCGHFWRFSE